MFRVQWLQEALDELAAIWTQGDSELRQAITAAAHALDLELAANPYRESESREGESEDRVLFVYPLGVQIEIDLPKRMVWVIHVWRFRRRGE
jgi:hypothetical protein